MASLLIMEHRAHDHDGSVINVLDYGAIGDDERDDTKAIRRTLKAAARMGGGTVLIPSNYIFCSGPLNLTSNITLQVDGTLKAIFPKQYVHFTINTNITNATPAAAITSWPIIPPLSIYGNSRDFKERSATKEYGRLGIYYFLQHQAFLHSYQSQWIRITGKGIIDGQGRDWWDLFQYQRNHNIPSFPAGRPTLLQFVHCQHVEIDSITLLDSPVWCVHPVLCQHVHIHHITIQSPLHAPNSDGIDPDSCQHVLVEHITM